jgi:type I restriction-modification system DNA methylase subunit
MLRVPSAFRSGAKRDGGAHRRTQPPFTRHRQRERFHRRCAGGAKRRHVNIAISNPPFSETREDLSYTLRGALDRFALGVPTPGRADYAFVLLKYTRLVSRTEIEANNFNLGLSRYFDRGVPFEAADSEEPSVREACFGRNWQTSRDK